MAKNNYTSFSQANIYIINLFIRYVNMYEHNKGIGSTTQFLKYLFSQICLCIYFLYFHAIFNRYLTIKEQ